MKRWQIDFVKIFKNIIFLILILVCGSSSFAQSNSNCSLNLKKDSDLSAYRYVFIPGILNEFITYYFTEHRRHLMLKDVPPEQIHRINIYSFLDPKDSASVIKDFVLSLPQDKEFIFFAHSKGALEMLYFLKDNYSEIPIKKAIFIQGALDGSSLTRLENEPGFFKVLKGLSGLARKTSAVSMLHRVFSKTEVRKNLFGLKSEEELLNKLIFVESKAEYERLALKFRPLGGLYRDFFGSPGDGVLMDSDHIPYEIREKKDICRIYYEVDHSELVKAAPWQAARILKIKNFLNRILFGFK